MSEPKNIVMRTRDLKKICSNVSDILVIGGGIHGADAAKGGYRTVLVEKNDFCSATSANSLKILHGGLRYLQHLNIKRMRHSILARREMMQLAPYLVEPLPCMMPLYGNGIRGKRVMQAALLVNDCIGWDRNHDLPAAIRLPRGHIVSKERCQQIVPDIEKDGLHGASVWYDALAVNTERLVLEYILSGLDYGAQAINYTAVTAVEKDDDELYRVSIRDSLNLDMYQLKTRYIVNAAGPWFEQILGDFAEEAKTKQQWALALNVVSKKKIFLDYAVALEGKSTYDDEDAIVKRGKRLYFFVPWRDCTMIGTNYEKSVEGPDDFKVRRETILKMINEINGIYPRAELKYEDISFYQAGLLPMRGETEQGDIQLEKNSTFYAHGDIGFGRVVSVKGVKYTTAPHVAHEIVHYLKKEYKPEAGSVQAKRVSAEDGIWSRGLLNVRGMLEKRYGVRAVNILFYMRSTAENDIWLDEGAQLLKAEVTYLMQEEMACKLSDIVFRRTGLGTAMCPNRELLANLAAFMANALSWHEDREEQEVEEVLLRYAPLCEPE